MFKKKKKKNKVSIKPQITHKYGPIKTGKPYYLHFYLFFIHWANQILKHLPKTNHTGKIPNYSQQTEKDTYTNWDWNGKKLFFFASANKQNTKKK